MSCPSSIRRRDLNPRPFERESTPITTRPGLPHINSVQNIRSFESLSSPNPKILDDLKAENFEVWFGWKFSLAWVWLQLAWNGKSKNFCMRKISWSSNLHGEGNYHRTNVIKIWPTNLQLSSTNCNYATPTSQKDIYLLEQQLLHKSNLPCQPPFRLWERNWFRPRHHRTRSCCRGPSYGRHTMHRAYCAWPPRRSSKHSIFVRQAAVFCKF